MNGEIKRYVAYKVSIGLLSKGNLELEKDKDDPTRQKFRFLCLQDKEINRINLIANVIDKFKSEEKNYASLTLDDGTGQIRVKAFSDNTKLIDSIQSGDTILVIGTLRYFNNELYILPEIIKHLDARWLLARKLELEKEYGQLYKTLDSNKIKVAESKESKLESAELKIDEEKQEEQEEKNEEKREELNPELSLREQIINIIKAAEPQEGINIDEIIMKLQNYAVEKINDKITELLEEGAIYEPKPGRLRIL